MKLYKVRFTYDATNFNPEWFTTYVVAVDMKDAIEYVSKTKRRYPDLLLGFKTLGFTETPTVGLVEECLHRDPDITELAKKEREGA